jgi:hypothetical protein
LCIGYNTCYLMNLETVTNIPFARRKRSNFSLLRRMRVEFQKLLAKLYN